MDERTHFTPGPWEIREARFGGEFEVYPTRPGEDLGGFGSWAEIATVSDGGDDEPAEANARLIAAAPDMFAALQAARQFIANGVELGFIRMPDASTPDPAHDTLPAIEAALAKARPHV